ncbi:MAG: transferrin-binding protein-like solute binding protein [Novosphingobium sp.]
MVEPAGAVRLAVDNTAKTYSLTFQPGVSALASIQFAFPADFGVKIDTLTKYSDGTSNTGTQFSTTAFAKTEIIQGTGKKIVASLQDGSLYYPAPAQYVTLGSWNLDPQEQASGGSYLSTGKQTGGSFVYGIRTIPADIPVTGKASYTVSEDSREDYNDYSLLYAPYSNTKLNVDFAARTIAALFQYSGHFEAGAIPVAVQASGISAISVGGDFNILLSGSATASSAIPTTSPVSGLFAGAFFGPQATEIGGVYSIPIVSWDGKNILTSNVQGAFTAARSSP